MKAAQPESDLDTIGHDLPYRQASVPVSPDREGTAGSKEELGRELIVSAKRANVETTSGCRRSCKPPDCRQRNSPQRCKAIPDPRSSWAGAKACRSMETGGCASLRALRGTL